MNRKTLLKLALGIQGKLIQNSKGFEVLRFAWDGKEYDLNLSRETYVVDSNYYGDVYNKTGKIKVILVGNKHNYFRQSKEYLEPDKAVEWLASKFNRNPSSNVLKYGIYGYYDGRGECVYIGKDSNIHINQRHKQHQTGTIQLIDKKLKEEDLNYKHIFSLESKQKMDFFESNLIKFLKPKYNIQHNKETKSADDNK